ncbi:hypothetical protein BB559_003765 [Furculomyces boomerangus]|uniref:Major facilitator superfamily (MFS) profile domain-containing protein n=2 Tax=Harpellales TaxID=61421 RepID=A0A2T9YIU9_9FUNG|nr:hypothetical protein BB559_006536 [Furculomyces boomerangus]PVU92268.1 hypothetical protein BB559_003765 [Furculomyces boomerangus]PWA00652.1 hypothetical protein BB558_003298 [Smittium angustum]
MESKRNSKATLLSQNFRNEYLSIREHEHPSSNTEAAQPKATITPIPWGQVLILILVRLSDPIGLALIFPFIYQFVKNSGIAKTSGEIGWYVGLMLASFPLAQSFTTIYWGRLSDRIGRKPVIMYGLVGSLVTTISFGFTNDFYIALIIRTLSGLLNGNVSIIKSSLAEISDQTNRAQVFAFLPLSWNVGGIVGPLIGGLLYDPSKKIPWLFGSIYVFEKYPHLLPCLVSGMLYGFGLILGISKLEETYYPKSKKSNKKTRSKKTKKDNLESKRDKDVVERSGVSLDQLEQSSSSTSIGMANSTSNDTISSFYKSNNNGLENLDEFEESEVLLSANDDTSSVFSYSSVEEERTFSDRFSSTMLVVLITNSTMTLAHSMFDNFFAVWSASEIDLGGLEFSPNDISLALGFCGLVVFYVQLVIYPYIDRKYGTIFSYRIGLLFVLPTSLILPIVSILAKLSNETGGVGNVFARAISLDTKSADVYYIIMWIVLEFVLCLRVFGSVFSFTGINLMVTNATLNPSDLGFMNGSQQTITSIVRVIGPILVGALWQLTSNSKLMYPFDHSFVWNLIGALYLYTWIKSKKIPDTVNKPIIENM